MKRLFAIVVTGVALMAIILLAATALASSAVAKDCLKVDDDHSPAATLSGRVTNPQKKATSGDMRPAKGPYLRLDTPLRADAGGGCANWREIAIMTDRDSQLSKWKNRRVAISGQLGRFGSALVSPPIFIEVATIKEK